MPIFKTFMVALFLVGSAGISYAATAAYMAPGQTYVVADMRDVVHDDGDRS